jgi:hypothetical protein
MQWQQGAVSQMLKLLACHLAFLIGAGSVHLQTERMLAIGRHWDRQQDKFEVHFFNRTRVTLG